jgi:Spy/CpxP family protein refolding chaperone
MKKEIRNVMMLGAASAFTLTLATSGVWANEPGYGKAGYGGSEHGAMRGHGMGMMHNSAGHLIRHLLKHEKEIGLTADQVTKLKEIQLNLDKTRIKSEADIQVAEREVKALTDDEKSDLGAIEAKLKQSEDLQVALRMTSIKTRRQVLGLLTPEQRQKEQAEHEKMMQQHKEGGPGGKNPHGSGMGTPHGGMMPGHAPKAADAPPAN